MTIQIPLEIHHVQEVGELAGVPPQSLQALQALGSLRTLEDGQILQIHGDENSPAVLVLSGTLMFGLTDLHGRRHVVRPVAAGQFFNVLPVFDRGPAIHDAYASGKTTLMLFEAQAFLHLVQKHHELRDALHQMLFYRNRLLWMELANIALLPLRQRCAQLLMQIMLPAHTASSQGKAEEISVSQTEISNMLGFTRQVVNRELRRLADEGVLDLNYKRIRVLQPQRLRGIAMAATLNANSRVESVESYSTFMETKTINL
jgi:CRP/FNR family transcriptional regulator, cyclic AMP receptor protein